MSFRHIEDLAASAFVITVPVRLYAIEQFNGTFQVFLEEGDRGDGNALRQVAEDEQLVARRNGEVFPRLRLPSGPCNALFMVHHPVLYTCMKCMIS